MILIAGGTGRLGTAIRALLDPARTRVLTRSSAAARGIRESGAEVAIADLAQERDADALARAVEGCSAVVLAASGFGPMGRSTPADVDRDGTTRLIGAADAAGVAHGVMISMHGAGPQARMPLLRMKWAAEVALRSSGTPWTIIRPSPFLETYLDAVGQRLMSDGSTLVFGSESTSANFVSVRDVAAIVADALRVPEMRGETLEWGGENLTLGQLAGELRTATGVTGPTRRIPVPALRAMAIAAKPFSPFLARVAEAAVIMNTTDMTFDAGPERARHPEIAQTSLSQAARTWAAAVHAVETKKSPSL